MDHENLAIVQDLYLAYENRDRDAAARLLAPDVVWHMPEVNRRPAHDLQGAEAVLQDMFDGQSHYEDGGYDVVDLLTSSDRVAVILKSYIRHGEDLLESDGVQIFRIRDHRIVEGRDFLFDSPGVTRFMDEHAASADRRAS